MTAPEPRMRWWGWGIDRDATALSPAAEKLLRDQLGWSPRSVPAVAPHGFTLGHFPQSFEYATLGGFVATRSAGQNSTGYGRIDELVQGLRLTAPAGEVVVPSFPSTAAGPSVEQLLVGSEGTLGV